LVRLPADFDDPNWVFEIKHDGFRALAHVRNAACTLTSRRGNPLSRFHLVGAEIEQSLRSGDAVIDAEIVCLDGDGRSRFYDLLFRRQSASFVAFHILTLDGVDLTALPLLERGRRLRAIVPRSARVLFHDHIQGYGHQLYAAAQRIDLEGIVAKWKHGPYQVDGVLTSWCKMANPEYSQIVGRREVFEPRRDNRATQRDG
jgi:bifunctional non-homologous end joining protein LigD